MDEISSLIPAKYLTIVVVMLAILRLLDGIIRTIPDDYLKAHTTFQAVVNAVKAVIAWATTKPTVPPAALAFVLLLDGCATVAPGHYVAIPPDPAACAAAGLAVYEAQKSCDVSPRPPVSQIIECAVASILAARPCVPTTTWVPDPAPTATTAK